MNDPAVSRQITRPACMLVLGMHRSGTSALSGVLSMLGCDLPSNTMAASDSNARGFFESTRIRDFNDALLAATGSAWDDLQEFDPRWMDTPAAADFLVRAREVLETEFGAARLIVLKDPRICRLLPFWLKVLDGAGYDVKPVLIQRNPLEVARSLNVKKGFGNAYGQMLWLHHVLDAEGHTRGMDRVHTSFERLMQGWEMVAQRIQDGLKIRWPRSLEAAEHDIETFLSSDLRHHQEGPLRLRESPLLTDWLRDAHAILTRWTETGETPGDHAALDRIRAELTAAAAKFNRVVRSERRIAETVRQQAMQYKDRLAEQKDRLAEQAGAAETLRARIGQLKTERQAFAERIGQQKQEYRAATDQLRVQISDQKRRLEETRAALTRVKADLAERTGQLAGARDRLEQRMAERAEFKSVIAGQKKRISRLTKDQEVLRRQLAAAEARQRRAEEDIGLLRNSTSWKLTRPLRRVMARLRGGRAG